MPDVAPSQPAPATCRRCDYDLRGLDPTSHCPECGLAIAFTLNPPTALRGAPPGWVRTLAIGAAFLLISLILFPVAGILIEAYLPYDGGPYQPQLRVHQQIYAAVCAFHALAAWVLTAREPRTSHFSRRRLGVWAARFGALGPIATYAVLIWPPPVPTLSQYPLWPAICFVPYVPVLALLFLHIRRLAVRLGRERLAEHAGIVGVGLSACVAGFMAWVLLGQDSGRVLTMLVVLPIAGVILFYFWALILLLGVTASFARAVGEARATWTHVDAAAAIPASTHH